MSNEKMTAAVSTARDGQQASLDEKKAWFRRMRPNGGMVLNPLRVTDQLAIFEARLFADTNDRNPLASFTATRSADKTTGKQYIRAAQEDALNEVLKNAGFGLPMIPAANGSGQGPAVVQVEAVPEASDGGQPVEAPAVAGSKQGVNKTLPIQRPKSEDKTAPSPAHVGPPPGAAKTPRPAPVGPQPRGGAGTASVVDIAARPVGATVQAAQPAAKQEQTGTVPQLSADTPAGQDAASPVEDDAPITYTADMTVEEIRRRMTLEQAKKIKVQDGTCKGWTLEQVATDRPPSLKWLKFTAPFADNVLKAAAGIVLDDLELKKAG